MSQQGTSTPGGAAAANPMPGETSKDTSRQHLAADAEAVSPGAGCGVPSQANAADKRTPNVAGGGTPITGTPSPRDGKPE